MTVALAVGALVWVLWHFRFHILLGIGATRGGYSPVREEYAFVVVDHPEDANSRAA